MSKEDIVPERADRGMFRALPAFGLAIVSAGMLLLPVWNYSLSNPSATSFSGDIIVLLYILSLPTFIFFLAGWSSTNLFSTVGATRC